LDAGEFVPDEITNAMVRERLRRADVEDGFILDGYPRTTAQVQYLDQVLTTTGLGVDAVLQLVVQDHEVVSRLLARFTEMGRSDDSAPVIQHRLDLYHRQTQPVAKLYSERGVLLQLKGNGTVSEITDQAIQAIEARMSAAPPIVPSAHHTSP
jgi:adenylate kinase